MMSMEEKKIKGDCISLSIFPDTEFGGRLMLDRAPIPDRPRRFGARARRGPGGLSMRDPMDDDDGLTIVSGVSGWSRTGHLG
jgi:hypothetical protein